MVNFSLSHTRGYVGCAIASEGDIGFDIERVRATPDLKDLILTTLTAAEISNTESLNTENLQSKQFFTYWVLKESVMKATGLGLGIEPRNISLSPCATSARIFDSTISPQVDGAEWRLLSWDIQGGGYVAGLAFEGSQFSSPQIRLHALSVSDDLPVRAMSFPPQIDEPVLEPIKLESFANS
jgi:hypothetical protein